MDGKKPVYSGDLEAAEPLSRGRVLQPKRTGASRGVPGGRSSFSNTNENSPTTALPIPFFPIPLANWKLFANLSLPGENAVYSLHDATGCFLDATDGCERLWNLSPKAIKGRALTDLLLPGKPLIDWLVDLDSDSQRATFPARALVEGAPERPVEIKRIPLFIGNDPKQSRIVLKTVASEIAIPQSQPSAFTLASVHSLDGIFIEVNDCWTDCLGFSKEEFEGRSLRDFVHPIDFLAADGLLGELNSMGSPCRHLLRFVDKAGLQKSLLVQGKKTRENEYISLNAKDMTLDRENPIANLLKVGMDLVQESVILLANGDSDFPVRYANQAFEELTGFSSSRISSLGLSCLHGSKTDPRSISRINSALNAEEELSVELLLYREGSDPFWSKVSIYPLRDTEGVTHYFAVVLEDATREKNAATELEAKNRELSEALTNLEASQKTVIQQENLRALGQMASGIAHDFNNLLAPILGFSELLLNMPAESRNSGKLESFLKKIHVAAQDGAAVVSRLREFYSAHNEEDEDYAAIEPKKLLSQVKDLTIHRWKNMAEARGANILFKTEIRTKRFINGNESELRQSLANLVINAVDSIKQNGTITISIEDKLDRVRIQVKDTGGGMPDRIRDRCLDAFYTTKGDLGTGLGLSIVCGIVKRHGGEINIDSKEGKGTVITMSFPAIEAEIAEQELGPLPAQSTPLNIMLVDDEAVLLEVISELLQACGHTVETFLNAESALEAYKIGSYDLIITDRAMPKMSGGQLAAEIKAINQTTPVYMMTGFSDLIKDTGENPPNIDAVLGKPIPLDTLNRKIADLVAQKSA